MAENDFKKGNVFNSPKESYFGVGSFLLEIIKVFVLAVVIITPIRIFLFQPFFVQGASMEPNFEDGQYLIINELGYKETSVGIGGKQFFEVSSFKELKRGDVIVFRYPKDPKQYFIKRVIGLPGEKIEIKENRIYIFNQENPDGFILNEIGYLPEKTNTSGDQTKLIGDGEYFVMGDNRSYSHDSRAWGTVGKEFIIGKVLVRAWPIGKTEMY
jgi:signal peptidase I